MDGSTEGRQEAAGRPRRDGGVAREPVGREPQGGEVDGEGVQTVWGGAVIGALDEERGVVNQGAVAVVEVLPALQPDPTLALRYQVRILERG